MRTASVCSDYRHPIWMVTTSGTNLLQNTSILSHKFRGKLPWKFQSVFVNGFRKVEDILQPHFFRHDFDFVNWKLVCELAEWGIGNCDEIFKFLRYNNHIFCVNKIYAIMKTFWCSTFAKLLSKPGKKNYLWLLAVNASNKFIQRTFERHRRYSLKK